MSRLDNCLTAIVGDKLPIETARKTFFFLLGIAVMLIVIALPSPSPFYKGEEAIPLTANAKIVMAVLCFAVIQWMTEAIPFPATSLCLIVFLHILGVASFDKLVTLGFGNNVLLFLMGAMGLSAAMTSSGLARRFMLWMLTKVGRRTDRIVLAFIAIGTMTSMWVTDMAVAAMLLPLGVSILESSGCKPLQSNFGRALMIGIVWGALIGGTATPAGCGPNVLAMQYVRDMAHMDVSFAQWMAVGVPGAMIMVPLGWFCLMKLFPPEFREIPTSLESIRAELNALGGLNTKEIRTLVVFLTMVTLWLGGSNLEPYIGFKAPEGFVALLGFVLLFVPARLRRLEGSGQEHRLGRAGPHRGRHFRGHDARQHRRGPLAGLGNALRRRRTAPRPARPRRHRHGRTAQDFLLLQQRHRGRGHAPHHRPRHGHRHEPLDPRRSRRHRHQHGLHHGHVQPHQRHTLLFRVLPHLGIRQVRCRHDHHRHPRRDRISSHLRKIRQHEHLVTFYATTAYCHLP